MASTPPDSALMPDDKPEQPDYGNFRYLIVQSGAWWLEILLHLAPGELPGPVQIHDLFNDRGGMHLSKVAHMRLHMRKGMSHEIDDPAMRADFFARLQIYAASSAQLSNEQARPDLALNAFPEGQGNIPTNPAVFTTISAIWKGGQRARNLIDGWVSGSDGQPIYQHASVSGGRISVYVQPGRLATAETLWALVEQLSPFTADVALAVLAQLCAPESGSGPQYPLLEPTRITADAILSYKGIQRWGTERAELRQRIAAEIERLRHLSFDVEAWPISGGPESEKASWFDDSLFDIVTVERGSEGKQASISWSIRAGQWAYWWLNASGRVFVGRMARALLELDHRENRSAAVLAKKIGQHVLLRAGSDRQTIFVVGVAALLADIGELPVEAARTKDWAGRIRDRLDEALLSLREAGIFVAIAWPDGYGPTDEDRQRGWVEGWLSARIELALARSAMPHQLNYQSAEQLILLGPATAPAQPADAEDRVSGQAIRRARAARQWKQARLALHLGISVPYLSQIEGERRQPSPQLAARLHAWLAEDATGPG